MPVSACTHTSTDSETPRCLFFFFVQRGNVKMNRERMRMVHVIPALASDAMLIAGEKRNGFFFIYL